MSADLLRKAAATLRERAEACEPWEGDDDSRSWVDEFDAVAHEREHGYHSPDVAYIATMHPGVGLALADVLDHAADNFYTYFNPHLDALARLILGDES